MRKFLFLIAICDILVTFSCSYQKSKCQSSKCSSNGNFPVHDQKISPYIAHYESLNYERDHLYNQQMRSKRSIDLDDFRIRFQFKAFQHDFHIVLKQNDDVFHERLQIIDSFEQPLHFLNTSHIYYGYLIDEPEQSTVFGSIHNHDGAFEGSIRSHSKGVFHIERVKHFLPLKHNSSAHSVIYKDEHIIYHPNSHKKDYNGACGITPDVSKWMDSIQNNAVDDHHAYFEPKNTFTTHHLLSPSANMFHNREKRSTKKRINDEIRNTCSLSIQTDPLLWRHIRQSFADHADPSKKLEVDEKTREEILSLIAQHVTAVNYIYRDTKFDGYYEHRNIKFEVQRIKIDDDSSCNGQQTENNSFCKDDIDVSNFLNLHSLRNHEIFCLAYVFTYRDFTGGTLGLAWVASASGASGGICEKFKTYTETIEGLYKSTKRSLNTGIITFVNYNTRVPPKVSQLTLAHEIGHNFGSPHDYPSECRPGGISGNYIMFASATSGDRPNNSKFSTCSIGNISNVLDSIESNRKFNCFTASAGAFCGNKIVEAGEECDCGYDKKECFDRCCYPRIFETEDLKYNETAFGCKRRKGTQCSPSQGPCCSHNCELIPAYPQITCREESDCSGASVCNGISPECPPPKPKENKTRCNNGTQLCIKGECSGSICLEWNLNECFLTSTKDNIDKRKLCELACQNGTDVSTCRSTSEFAHLVGLPPGGISLRPGSPCDNFQGYCDVFLKCRAVDAEGPLVRLKNLLLNKETLSYVIQWVTIYWWAVLLMAICFIIIMGLFIKCCAVYTPSSNPKKPPARRITHTLSAPMNTLRRMRRYTSNPHNGSRSRSNGSRSNQTCVDHRLNPGQHVKSSLVAYSRANLPSTNIRAYSRNSSSNEQWNHKV